MEKWLVIGITEDFKTGICKQKEILVYAKNKEDAITKGLNKLKTKRLVKCNLTRSL